MQLSLESPPPVKIPARPRARLNALPLKEEVDSGQEVQAELGTVAVHCFEYVEGMVLYQKFVP